MKKWLAILLTLAIVGSMVACDSKTADDQGQQTTAPQQQTVEMKIQASGLDDKSAVTLTAPANMQIKEKALSYVFTDETQNVSVETYLYSDYNCYSFNQEASKALEEGYGEQKFGNYDGYYYLSASGPYVEAYVYLGIVAELDDVYLSFTIGAPEGQEAADPMALFRLPDVQAILSSAVFTPAQAPAQ